MDPPVMEPPDSAFDPARAPARALRPGMEILERVHFTDARKERIVFQTATMEEHPGRLAVWLGPASDTYAAILHPATVESIIHQLQTWLDAERSKP